MNKNIFRLIIVTFILHSFNCLAEEILFELEAKKLSYQKKNEKIIAHGNAVAWDKKNRKIFADKIIYDRVNKKISTFGNSKYYDGKNTIEAKEFNYDLTKKIIFAEKNVIFFDSYKNQYHFNKFEYHEDKQKGYGFNANVKLNDGSTFISKKVEIDYKNGLNYFENSYYTTCKKINNNKDKYCPNWSLNSKKILHDNKTKIVTHTNSIVRLKNIPIFYTPYISHPDPSIKRKTGFLPPTIKSISNLGRTLKTPFFWAIDMDKDLTLTPVYYFNQKNMLNASYRQVFDKGYLKVETSYSGGYKDTENNRSPGSRNYLFLDFEKKIKNETLKKSKIDFVLQRVSQKNYLRVNQLNTRLFDENIRNLENKLSYSLIDHNKKFQIGSYVLENLDEENKKKYTFIFPEGSFDSFKKLNNNFTANFSTSFMAKKFLDTQKQGKVLNNLQIFSKQLVNNYGIGTTLKANLINNNIYNNNISDQEGGNNIDNYATIALDSIIPFVKKKPLSISSIAPRVFAKYTTGKTKNNFDKNKILETSDIFSLNRASNLDNPETGLSLGYGAEYSYKLKDYDNSIKLKSNFNIGQVIKRKRDDNMPNQSSLNNSSSDFVGLAKITYYGEKNNSIKEFNNLTNQYKQNYFDISYKFNLDTDFNRFPRNEINLRNVYNNLAFNINFNEKNNHLGATKSLETNISKLINEKYYLNYTDTRNFKDDYARSKKLGLNYEDDCLLITLSYGKSSYEDQDLKSNDTLVLNLIFKPFGDAIAPDLSGLVK